MPIMLMLARNAMQAETIELSSDTEESEAEASRYDALSTQLTLHTEVAMMAELSRVGDMSL